MSNTTKNEAAHGAAKKIQLPSPFQGIDVRQILKAFANSGENEVTIPSFKFVNIGECELDKWVELQLEIVTPEQNKFFPTIEIHNMGNNDTHETIVETECYMVGDKPIFIGKSTPVSIPVKQIADLLEFNFNSGLFYGKFRIGSYVQRLKLLTIYEFIRLMPVIRGQLKKPEQISNYEQLMQIVSSILKREEASHE